MQGERIILEKDSNEERSFWYDGDGKPAVFNVYSSSTGGIAINYYYMYNAQGDVIGLYDNAGNIVCRYYYDAWGKLLKITDGTGIDKTNDTSFVGYKNPIRYRAYYYDNETGMYYLQSRYYNPEIKRFINADSPSVLTVNPNSLVGKNLYSYCNNNPVILADENGRFLNLIIGAAVGAVAGVVSNAVSNVIAGEPMFKNWGVAAVTGGASGLLASTGIGLAGQVIGNAAISMWGNARNQMNDPTFSGLDWGEMAISGIAGAIGGKIGGSGCGNYFKKSGSALGKRLSNSLAYNDLKSGLKETTKAVVNYAKNTKTNYSKQLSSSIKKATIAATSATIGMTYTYDYFAERKYYLGW